MSLANKMFGWSGWQNSGSAPHTVASKGTMTSINCGGGNVESGGYSLGAYRNVYDIKNNFIYNSGASVGGQIWATGTSHDRITVKGGSNGISFMHHTLVAPNPTVISNCSFSGLTGRPIRVAETCSAGSTSQPNAWDLINNGLNINDPLSNFDNFNCIAPGSVVRMQEGNQARRITSGGQVTTIAPFA